MLRSLSSIFTVIGLVFGVAGQALSVTLNSGGVTSLDVQGRDTSLSMSGSDNTVHPTLLPFNQNLQFTHGAATGITAVDLSDDGFHTTITQLVRPSRIDSYTKSDTFVYFSVSSNTIYNASGTFSVVDSNWASGPASVVRLIGTLKDMTTGDILFDSQQDSEHTPNASLTLGEMGGDNSSWRKMEGSLTGTLLPGHNYFLDYEALSYMASSNGWSATASGQIDLELTPVPEPSTIALLGMSAFGLLACAWRWRRKAV